MAAATGRVRMKRADGGSAVSSPFSLDRGGVQGGMSTLWTYILGSSEVMEGDESRLHDLDFAIRRECLRLEVNRRDVVEDGEEPAAEAADDGQRRWDEAVRVGGLALMAARDDVNQHKAI